MPRAGQTREQQGCVPRSASVLTAGGRIKWLTGSGTLKRQSEIITRFILQRKEHGDSRLWPPFLAGQGLKNLSFTVTKASAMDGKVQMRLCQASAPTIRRGTQHQHPFAARGNASNPGHAQLLVIISRAFPPSSSSVMLGHTTETNPAEGRVNKVPF